MNETFERLEVIVHGPVNGARSGEILFRTRESAERYLRLLQDAICHEGSRDGEFAVWDFSDVKSAWIAGEDSGQIYFQ